MKKFNPISNIFIKSVAYLLALLFVYAAASKMLEFENFQVQLAQSPLLSAYAGAISYLILIVEFVVAIALCLKGSQLIALYGSMGLMVAFTVYIYIILNFSDFIPCSCGGILEKLSWKDHLIFNIIFVLLTFAAIIVLSKKRGKMLWQTLGLSTGVITLSFSLVILLFIGSEHIIKKENNFTRRFLNHAVIEEQKMLILENPDYYFAGHDDTHIYLGNRIFPQVLITADTALANENLTKIVADHMNHPFSNLRLQVLPPYYYFYDGTVPVIFRGRLGDPKAKTLSYEDAFFNQLVVLDSARFAIRTQSSATKQFTLGLLDLSMEPKVKLYPEILERQYDGVFDMDGNFSFDRHLKNLIYTYLYRNQYIVMDGEFRIKNKLNTIDTTSIAQIKITKLGDGRHKLNAPPFKVNSQSTAFGGLLFNQSDLMGKLESRQAWKDAKVVDIYRTDRQEYIGSFYIYHRKEMKMRDFMITGNYMYVLRGHELVRYRIRDIIKKNYTRGEAENLHKE